MPPSPMRPVRPFIIIVLTSILLTLLTVGIIWKATEQVLQLKNSRFTGESTVSSAGGSAGMVVGMPAPMVMDDYSYAREEAGMDASYNSKSIMPMPPTTPGAGP